MPTIAGAKGDLLNFDINFKTITTELSALLVCDLTDITANRIITQFSNTFNSNGMRYYTAKGDVCDSETAVIACYDTEYLDKDGKAILGYFERVKLVAKWKGIKFITQQNIKTIFDTSIDISDFGWIDNLNTMHIDLKAACATEASHISQKEMSKTFKERQKSNEIIYYNPKGKKCAKSSGVVACYNTGYADKDGIAIFGYFERDKPDNDNHDIDKPARWNGIGFATEKTIIATCTNTFKCGKIRFLHESNEITARKKAEAFFCKLSEDAIPESWAYKSQHQSFPYPVLKSFIEYTYGRLIREQREQKDGHSKIITNDNYVLFNTGLLDKWFNVIYIVAKRLTQANSLECFDPKTTTSIGELKAYGRFQIDGKPVDLEKIYPDKANFFKKFDEVIYQINFPIDKLDKNYNHILVDRRERFPDKYADTPPGNLAIVIKNAMSSALLMAERNYKFIVPQYRPTKNKIQFLMPLYLENEFHKAPDLALVLDPVYEFNPESKEEELSHYVPETILELDSAYQNARLIAKPDIQWLDPKEEPKS